MIRPAPSALAARTPLSPTAPSPTTTTVDPGVTRAETAACQPVAMTSLRARNEGMSAPSGRSSAVPMRTSEPSAWVTRASSPWPLVVKPRLMHADCCPARQCTHVPSQWSNGTMTMSPTRKSRTSAPTSTISPTHSWPMVAPGIVTGASPRYRQRSEPQTHPAMTRTTASVGLPA